MADRIHYTSCPVCGSVEWTAVFPARDYTVSREEFSLLECSRCSLRFTQDVPGPDSIGPYYKAEEYISHTNTSKGLVNQLYQLVRRRTLAGKRKKIRKYTGLQQGRVLDYGCGTGAFAHAMQQAGWSVMGLEPDTDARALAKKLYGLDTADTGALFDLEPASFDAITLWHVLEHVHDLKNCVRRLGELLKTGGRLFVAVPNYTSLDASIYREYWAAYDVPRHLYHFSPASMAVLMQANGLKVVAHLPMWYDSFYVSILSSRYRHGHTRWPGALATGLRSNLRALRDVSQCSSVVYVLAKG